MLPLRKRKCCSSALKDGPVEEGRGDSSGAEGALGRPGVMGSTQSPVSSWRTISSGSKSVHSVMTNRLLRRGLRAKRSLSAVASTALKSALLGSGTVIPRRTNPLQGVYIELLILTSVPSDRPAASRMRC